MLMRVTRRLRLTPAYYASFARIIYIIRRSSDSAEAVTAAAAAAAVRRASR